MIIRTLLAAASLSLAVSTVSANPNFWKHEWPRTDFENTSVSWIEVMSGGPPKDGIPALDDPSFINVSDESRIAALEPVITLELEGETPRAYPIRYLTWHEIVNDTVGGVPVAVTFCPLCNSALVFDRLVSGRTLSFGVSGLLRHSDMIMYDRETESWWQQAIGTGIAGAMNGAALTQLPSWMESWAEFRATNPKGRIMDEPNWARRYGQNPYVGYDSASRPFLYRGENPPHGISPLMRVVRVGDTAWTLDKLSKAGEIRAQGLVISWRSGQASALDSAVIGQGRDVGTIRVRNSAGQDVPHDVMFAFAFHAFFPNGQWQY